MDQYLTRVAADTNYRSEPFGSPPPSHLGLDSRDLLCPLGPCCAGKRYYIEVRI
jgi:hypothetical protein